MFIFYHLTTCCINLKFKIKLSYILSVAEYPDYIYSHINILYTQPHEHAVYTATQTVYTAT